MHISCLSILLHIYENIVPEGFPEDSPKELSVYNI